METHSTQPNSEAKANTRRRRWPMTQANVRYFLAKTGSSAEAPQLGEECGSETEVLLKAFQSRDVFFTIVAWRAVADTSTDEAKITMQAVEPK